MNQLAFCAQLVNIVMKWDKLRSSTVGKVLFVLLAHSCRLHLTISVVISAQSETIVPLEPHLNLHVVAELSPLTKGGTNVMLA